MLRGDVNGLWNGDRVIAGWAWNSEQPDAHVVVAINSSAGHAASIAADQPRRDLIHFGNGDHAFRFHVPDEWFAPEPVRVTLTYAETGEVLPRGVVELPGMDRRTPDPAAKPSSGYHAPAFYMDARLSGLPSEDREDKLPPFDYMAETGSVRTFLRLCTRLFRKRDPKDVVFLLAASLSWDDSEVVEQALALVPFAAAKQLGEADPRLLILVAEAQSRLGEVSSARRVLLQGLEQRTQTPDLWFGLARLAPVKRELRNEGAAWERYRHTLLSEAFRRLGCDFPIMPSRKPLSFHQLSGPLRGRIGEVAPKTSILLPLRGSNPAQLAVVRSILAQTETTFELLVTAASCSGGLAGALRAMAAEDCRVRLLEMSYDGSYWAALNQLFSVSVGDFVIPACGMQWWAATKLERHLDLAHLDSGTGASVGFELLVSDSLVPLRRFDSASYMELDTSSVLLRRSVVEQVGGWLPGWIGSEEDMLLQLRRAGIPIANLPDAPYRSARKDERKRPPPVAVRLAEANWATEIGNFGVVRPTVWATHALAEIRDARSFGAATSPGQDAAKPIAAHPRLLPSPNELRDRPRRFDVILASNFTIAGGSVQSCVEEITAQHRAGMSTGLIQLRNINSSDGLGTRRYMLDGINRLLSEGAAERILPGETAYCDLLVIRYPPVLDALNPFLGSIRAREVRVIMNQPPRRTEDAEEFYDLLECTTNLQEMMGTRGIWSPIGPLARFGCREYLDRVPFSPEDWYNIIDVEQWTCRQDGFVGDVPVIGRHARDDTTKWPEIAADIASAYLVDQDGFEVRILGGASTATGLLGRTPRNWTVYPYGSMSAQDYLDRLDFFVFFPHSQRIEAFGRTIIEAMAAGVPVILPKVFSETFGEAAIYADPCDVRDIVARLYNDPQAYRERRRIGRATVEQRFSHAEHIRRVRQIIGEGTLASNKIVEARRRH